MAQYGPLQMLCRISVARTLMGRLARLCFELVLESLTNKCPIISADFPFYNDNGMWLYLESPR